MNFRARFLLCLAMVTFSLASSLLPVAAFAEMRIFELQHRTAGEIAGQVRNLLGEDARVAAHQNTLVVNASSADLEVVAALVTSYDRAQKMLRITINQNVDIQDGRSDARVAGRVGLGNVSVGVGSFGNGAAGSVWFGSGQSSAGVQARESQRLETRHANQFINVLDGSPAMLSVGRAVPFTSQLRSYYRRHAAYVESVAYRNVDTGFEVLPEMSGNMVRLTIRPFMAFMDAKNPDHVVFHDLSTTVTVPLGAWYDLGGHAGVIDGLSREILRVGQHADAGMRLIRLRVDTEQP